MFYLKFLMILISMFFGFSLFAQTKKKAVKTSQTTTTTINHKAPSMTKKPKGKNTQAEQVCMGYKNTVENLKEHCLKIKMKENNNEINLSADCSKPIPKFPIIFNKITLKYFKKTDECKVNLLLKSNKTKKLHYRGNKNIKDPNVIPPPKPKSKSL